MGSARAKWGSTGVSKDWQHGQREGPISGSWFQTLLAVLCALIVSLQELAAEVTRVCDVIYTGVCIFWGRRGVTRGFLKQYRPSKRLQQSGSLGSCYVATLLTAWAHPRDLPLRAHHVHPLHTSMRIACFATASNSRMSLASLRSLRCLQQAPESPVPVHLRVRQKNRNNKKIWSMPGCAPQKNRKKKKKIYDTFCDSLISLPNPHSKIPTERGPSPRAHLEEGCQCT